MFKIRREQAEAYQAVMLEGFEERAVRHLREFLPEETAGFSEKQLVERVRQSIPRAEAYGLTTEMQVMYFVSTTFLVGERFDRDPSQSWAVELLHHPKLDSDEKASALFWMVCNIHSQRSEKEG